MKPENIFLVRHGQSEGNVDKEIYKTKPDYTLKLTPKGILQATVAGNKIAEILKDKNTAFYISPFWRTRQTAENIKKAFKAEQIMMSFEDVRLREQEWGSHIQNEFNDGFEEARDAYGSFYWRFPNGESCADVFDRVSDFFPTLYRDFDKFNYPRNTVIVTHGMAMRVFLMRWFHLTVEEFELLANPDNCDYYHLQLKSDGKYKLVNPAKKYEKPIHPYQYREGE
jgi:broad specificity phosphatase PhoE